MIILLSITFSLELVYFNITPHLFAKILFIFIIEVRESENIIDKEHSFFDRKRKRSQTILKDNIKEPFFHFF
jgi:hypothetical protein